VLGSHNKKKGEELAELLARLGVEVRTLADFDEPLKVEETGDSFLANARLKAVEQARHLRHWILGEDSGLAVDALGGAPGIYSARFAGEDATDLDNNRKLLAQMAEVPEEGRSAHYVCTIAVSDPAGEVRAESEGRCCGRITTAPRGAGGFGYDPLFEIREYHRTFGELGSTVKSVLSHRARAVRRLLPRLEELMASGAWKV